MYPNIILKIFYSFLFITSTGLLSSCVSSVFIGSAQPESEVNQVSGESASNQLYATRASYLVFQEASTQTIYDHRNEFSEKQQAYQSEIKAQTHRNPKVLNRINRLEKKVSKRAKQHLKADLKEMRAQAKLERALRKAGLLTIPYFPYYKHHTHDYRCHHPIR